MTTVQGAHHVLRPRSVRLSPAVRELMLLAAVYLGYTAARRLTISSPGQPLAHASSLWNFERASGLAPEQWLNQLVSSRPWLAVPTDFDYATLHYVVTPAVLVWLWRSHRSVYARRRRALVVATLLGLVGFVLYPLAPPRMLPGFVDTMARFSDVGWWGTAASAPRGLGSLTNQFAAMPSLHVGWALWCGWMLVAHASRRWVRALGVLYPLVTTFVVLGTANHYLLDAVGGVVVMSIGLLAARR